LSEHAAVPGKGVLAGPYLGPELEVDEPDLLCQLPAKPILDVFLLVDAAAGRRPPDLPGRVAKLDEQGSAPLVEDECPRREPVNGIEPCFQRAEPSQPVGVRNGGVRR